MSMARVSGLAQLELDCMKVLWSGPGATVAQVRSALARPLAYTTVMTVLDRMAAKGVVTRRKNGRAWLYSPQLDRDTARLEAVGRLLANLFDGDRAALVQYLSRRRVARLPSAGRVRRAGVPPAVVRASSPAPSRRAGVPSAVAGPSRPRSKARVPRPPAPSTPTAIDEFLL